MRELVIILPGNNHITPIRSEDEESMDQWFKDIFSGKQEPKLLEFVNGTRKSRINSRSILGWCFRDADASKTQREVKLAETMQTTMEKIGNALAAEDDSDKWKRGED